jgi:hypothetical protein
MGKLDRQLSEETQMANTFMKKQSTSLAVREMQIKTPVLRFYYTTLRLAIIKKTNNKCWWGYGEKEPSYNVGGNVNWCYGNQYGRASKN